MKHGYTRRNFLGILGTGAAASSLEGPLVALGPHRHALTQDVRARVTGHGYNGPYSGPFLDKLAFPIGGLGAGMFCLEGAGAVSHVSIRNRMEVFYEPCLFGAICIKGNESTARVLEGPIPEYKMFGTPGTGNGAAGTSYGLPRFEAATFEPRFPFGTVTLQDPHVPLECSITGWSPFTPGDADNSSLPVGALEYSFSNPTRRPMEAVFSYNTMNWRGHDRERRTAVSSIPQGFVHHWEGTEDLPHDLGSWAFFVDDLSAVIDHSWFRGGWWDPLTIAWKNIAAGGMIDNPPQDGPATGASLFVPIRLGPGQERTVRLLVAWYCPRTNLRIGPRPFDDPNEAEQGETTYVPWYAGRFGSIEEVAEYWRSEYDNLKRRTQTFTDALYDTNLPAEVTEAVAANLTILKSPTTMRQIDGRLWCWEGCSDNAGCCAGSCTHVWNYAQAIPHLFPDLERSLRQTEFHECQNADGHQRFRAYLPIRTVGPEGHGGHAASDGQLGGIMKVHREWRVSGDTGWLRDMWPRVKQSLDYCIRTWDPKHKGIAEEPHHNTYDIEFWGPDGMITGFYLGALTAAVAMGEALGDDVTLYHSLLENGKSYIETELYNGEYFYQKIQWQGLNATYDPIAYADAGQGYSDVVAELNSEGPKYQYGTGCLSDVVLGFWLAKMCGLGDIVDVEKVRSSLRSIHRYNLRSDLSAHANPQRPSYALGKEGGLLLCSWPKGGALSIPFVYSNEVWTGIEYQVASHLMLEGMVQEGLEIVRICRDRYSGAVRNPFNEYECGHWYARALSSYGLLQGLTGARYDAVEKTLYIDSKVGDNFRCFLSTATGFGTVGLDNGTPFVDMKTGTLDVERCVVSGRVKPLRA
jgi:uncharacterized protein (DUF608 family)